MSDDERKESAVAQQGNVQASQPEEEEDLANERWVPETDYPLRKPEEDPRWAVNIVWIWMGLGLASLLFIIVMLVMGAFY
jgi:hypothetical protein